MATTIVVRKNEYYDSVFLMRVAKRISEQPGIKQAAALMGTDRNKTLLKEIGIEGPELERATAGDLVLAVEADSTEDLRRIVENVDGWLQVQDGEKTERPVRSLEEALVRQPRSNLAVISVPGEYAAREARKALERGLHVFLFSDNVPVEEERSLKEYALKEGLLVMGPDCGTALLGGIGVGFANRVRRGSIGVVGASGTGIQEFTSLVHKGGGGISHALGTGSNDIGDTVGGITLQAAYEALVADGETKVIAVISKPPGKAALDGLLSRVSRSDKPTVLCFLGLKDELSLKYPRCFLCRTLDEAAAYSLQLFQGGTPSLVKVKEDFSHVIGKERAAMHPGQRFIRGLFAGGTFCYQAQQILQEAGLTLYSNAPLKGVGKLADSLKSRGHSLIDLGADEFTRGRPHPMIDSRTRRDRLLIEAGQPDVALILLDFILGYNASPDPAGELIPAILQAKEEVKRRGGYLTVVASVCGTDEDPQDLAGQVRGLREAGVVVLPSTAEAARFTAEFFTQEV